METLSKLACKEALILVENSGALRFLQVYLITAQPLSEIENDQKVWPKVVSYSFSGNDYVACKYTLL